MERKESIEKKKEEIKKDPKGCLEAVLLKIPHSNSDETLEWAIAFAEYFDEHPDEWGEIKAKPPDPPVFKSFKEKLENFLDLFGKVKPR